MVLKEEEEEEVGRSRDHKANKGVHLYHPSVISYSWQFGRVLQ